jgi:hypothetical protein
VDTLEELYDAPTFDQSPPFNIEGWEVGGGGLAKHDADVKWKLGDWLVRGRELAKRDAEVKWELGDWLTEGEPHYPDIGAGEIQGVPAVSVYSVAENITGLARGTLRDLASTARRVPPSVRTDACTWSHHRALINALPDADEDTIKQWLKRAADEKMSVAELQDALRSPVTEAVKEKSFLVTVPLNVWETLKDFADHECSSVQKIAALWVSENSRLEKTQAARETARLLVKERRREKRRRVGLRVARTYDPLGLQRQ